jgi:uncharacterized membrane protein
VTLSYDVPAGPLGRAVAKYFGEEPHQQLDDDLRRFKQVIETARWCAPTALRAASARARSSRSIPRGPLSDEELAEVRS